MVCCFKFELLSQADAETLIWNRFINVHGKPGCNIPQNLHMEHLNRIVKEAVKGLGSKMYNIFQCVEPRSHTTYANPKDVLSCKNLHDWTKTSSNTLKILLYMYTY